MRKILLIFILIHSLCYGMSILTPQGYKNVDSMSIGDSVLAYDINDGHIIYNQLLGVERLDKNWFESIGDSSFTWYLVNGSYKMFKFQSIWNSPTTVVHSYLLNVGDTIYDDFNNDLIVTSIEETTPDSIWYRLTISGDHSFISDGITYHNASRFWVTGGVDNNWGTTGNWSTTSGGGGGSSVPTSADDVTFDGGGNSNCTINASARSAKTLTYATGYTSTTTFSQNLTVSGSVTLISGMNFSGSSTLAINAAATITSNTKTTSVPLSLSGAVTYTLSDNLTTSSTLTIGSTAVINSNTINIGGDLVTGNNNSITGTSLFKFTGTGTWNSATNGNIANNIEFAMGSGTLTLGSVNCKYNGTGTITYTSGSFGGTGTLQILGACTMTLTGATIPNVFISVAGTVTNSGNFTISTLLTLLNGNQALVLNGSTITCGSLTTNAGTSGTVTGTTEIIVNGSSGVLTNSGAGSNQYRLNTTINSSGSVTISGTFKYGTGIWKLSSDITSTGILSLVANATIDGNGKSIPKLSIDAAGITVTLNSNLILTSDFSSSTATAASKASVVSNSGGTQRKLTLNQGATQDLGFTNFTDINAGDGQTLWVWKPTLNNTININSLTAQRTFGSTF